MCCNNSFFLSRQLTTKNNSHLAMQAVYSVKMSIDIILYSKQYIICNKTNDIHSLSIHNLSYL